MDDALNRLRELGKPGRFQLMTPLSFMWSVVLCFALGAWLRFDEPTLAHMAVPLGITFTGMAFRGVGGGAPPALARAAAARRRR